MLPVERMLVVIAPPAHDDPLAHYAGEHLVHVLLAHTVKDALTLLFQVLDLLVEFLDLLFRGGLCLEQDQVFHLVKYLLNHLGVSFDFFHCSRTCSYSGSVM